MQLTELDEADCVRYLGLHYALGDALKFNYDGSLVSHIRVYEDVRERKEMVLRWTKSAWNRRYSDVNTCGETSPVTDGLVNICSSSDYTL